MSRLFIAEKPSLAQAVMAVLPGRVQRNGVAARVADDYFVPLAGHALEQAMPDEYLPDDVPLGKNGKKKWREQDLPIVPKEWILHVRENMQRNVDAIEALLAEVDEVVHLGDPDAEGQLLVDEVLLLLSNTRPVRRLLVNDYNEGKVRQALANLRDNDEPEFRAWYRWALARSHYDWLFGLNITRAATLRARQLGFDGVLTVGSVQTPALKIVVDRDRAIEAFRPVPYFTVSATLGHANGSFVAKWKPSDEQAGIDDAGRLVDEAVATALTARLQGKAATITDYEKAPKRENPPLPLSLNELTVVACSRYGYTGEEVLDAAQTLYERPLQLTTYPRTEVRYLSEAQHADAPAILAALTHNLPTLAEVIAKADPARKSAAFDDSKVDGTSHHGIVPTVARADGSALTEIQRNVYDLIVRSYLAQFFEAAVFMQTKIEALCDGEHFAASGRTPVSAGWREVYAPHDEVSPTDSASRHEATREPGSEPATESAEEAQQVLPSMVEGDVARCTACEATSRATKPPSRFDEALLTAAMIDLQKYTTDPAAKARLKEGKGIGTSATRAGIIKDLRERGFLVPAKGSKTKFVSSTSGRGLIDALPGPVKDPTMAGLFKIALDAVATGEITYEHFIERNVAFVTKVVAGLRTAAMTLPVAAGVACPKCGTGKLRRIAGSDGHFWGCSNWQATPKCSASYPDLDGQPDLKARPKGKPGGRKKGAGFSMGGWA
jgi:DNA topoisomerase III